MPGASRSSSPRLRKLAKAKALQLACFRARQRFDVLDGARVLVRRDLALDELLQLGSERGIADVTALQDDVRLDDLSAFVVRRADDAAFRDNRMQQQRGFDFRAGDVI